MENNELLIQDVTLARCGETVEKASHVNNKRISHVNVVEFTVEKTITCVVDKENNVAIDIETCKIWPIMKRDENNRIIGEVLIGQLYPVVFMDKKWDEISYLYQLSLKNRAKEVYKRYLENKQKSKNDKVKIKTRKN